jgi:ribose transport system ATP-binding protein
MGDHILEIENLSKNFPGVKALDDVSFNINRNTIHCIVGENGAGKSTLIKIITGALLRTGGKILFNGKEYVARGLKDSQVNGISTLFQELNTVDHLTVSENLVLGSEDTFLMFLKKTKKVNEKIKVLEEIEPNINPRFLLGELSFAQKQLVEIAKAIAGEANIIIMDEPTASISKEEKVRFFKIIKKLKNDKDTTFIYISHKLDEIFELGDYVTVLRDGKHIETKAISEVKNKSELIRLMLGRTVFEKFEVSDVHTGEKVLEALNISNDKLNDITFDVKKGEVIGFYGLVGAGKTELARAIYGLDDYRGELFCNGKKLKKSVLDAVNNGIVLLPEERRAEGLFNMLTVRSNITAMNLREIAKKGFLFFEKEKRVANEYVKKFDIDTPTVEKEIDQLSGGNQQKAIFSKCLFSNADVLLLDEPTRGIDIGAKEEIYEIIRELALEGKSIIIFSSELSDIVNNCERIFTLFEGAIKSEIKNEPDINEEYISNIASGGQ